MGQLHCIRHSSYRGEETPILSCKACCEIHIEKSEGPARELLHSTQNLNTKVEDNFHPQKWLNLQLSSFISELKKNKS